MDLELESGLGVFEKDIIIFLVGKKKTIQTGINALGVQRLTGMSILPDVASWCMALRHLRSEIADQTSVVNLVFPILSRPGPSLSSSRNSLSNSLATLECLKYLMVLRMVLIIWSQQWHYNTLSLHNKIISYRSEVVQ
jgi:hypothetical protein